MLNSQIIAHHYWCLITNYLQMTYISKPYQCFWRAVGASQTIYLDIWAANWHTLYLRSSTCVESAVWKSNNGGNVTGKWCLHYKLLISIARQSCSSWAQLSMFVFRWGECLKCTKQVNSLKKIQFAVNVLSPKGKLICTIHYIFSKTDSVLLWLS